MPLTLNCVYAFIICSTDFPMAVTALVLIFMTTAFMLQSVNAAPLISTDDTQDTNLINDEGVEINATQKIFTLRRWSV